MPGKSARRRPPIDRRRATVERNIDAICRAVARLVQRGDRVSIAAVASEARLSRVTVYAHFATRRELIAAALDRSVRSAAVALEAARPDAGSPVEALDRLITVGWQALERASGMVQATAAALPSESRRRLHAPAFAPIHRLVKRGQQERVFRTDVSSDWLVAVVYALIHAAADEVRAGRLDATSAPKVLTVSLHDLFQANRKGGTGLRPTR